jgi:hypothetical protein
MEFHPFQQPQHVVLLQERETLITMVGAESFEDSAAHCLSGRREPSGAPRSALSFVKLPSDKKAAKRPGGSFRADISQA